MEPIMLAARTAPHTIGYAGRSRHLLWGILPKFILWDMLIIILVAVIFYWLVRGSKDKPLDAAKRRYAKGEITREEFIKIKEDLAD